MKQKCIGIILCSLIIFMAVLPVAGTGKTKINKPEEKNIYPTILNDNGQLGSKDGWALQWSHVYGGNGHAQFAQPVGDINGDGRNEIILGGYENTGICRILTYNTTQETYVQLYSWAVAGGSPSGACVIDLDEDGALEFCVSWTYSGANGVYAYRWDGPTPTQLAWYHGTGADFIYDIYACDYDDDGHREVLIANDPNPGGSHVAALGWNIDSNTFQYETSWTCPGGSGMACPMVWSGDVDNDNKTEVIADVSDLNYATAGTWALNWNQDTENWEGVPIFTNYPAGTTVFGDGVGDVDNDGTPEIGVGSYGGTPAGWLFEWNGAGYNEVWHEDYPGQEPCIESVAINDADNDGAIEFCFGTGNVHVIGWDGNTYYEEATLTGPTNMLAGLIIGDCDSDGSNEVKGCEILGGTGSEFIWKYADTTPPVTTCHLNGTLNGSIYVSDVTISFTATDDGSGVSGTFYSFDNTTFEVYTSQLLITEDGSHTVYFYSTDVAGNTEETKSSTFTIQHPASIEITHIKGGIGISATFQNMGTEPSNNIPWSISIKGGFILSKNETSGTILQLQPGENSVKHLSVIGFGRITITVSASNAEKTATGLMFLFFVVGVK